VRETQAYTPAQVSQNLGAKLLETLRRHRARGLRRACPVVARSSRRWLAARALPSCRDRWSKRGEGVWYKGVEFRAQG